MNNNDLEKRHHKAAIALGSISVKYLPERIHARLGLSNS
jgi:hypothetical protein